MKNGLYRNLVVAATGSGKTLISFKAVALVTEIPAIDKAINSIQLIYLVRLLELMGN